MAPAPPAATTAAAKAFTATEALTTEMARLSRLRREEPDVAASMISLGDSLVKMASTGNLRQLASMVGSIPKVNPHKWISRT